MKIFDPGIWITLLGIVIVVTTLRWTGTDFASAYILAFGMAILNKLYAREP